MESSKFVDKSSGFKIDKVILKTEDNEKIYWDSKAHFVSVFLKLIFFFKKIKEWETVVEG